MITRNTTTLFKQDKHGLKRGYGGYDINGQHKEGEISWSCGGFEKSRLKEKKKKKS
jgi:hypothetical protein